jgi:hypothetical protein
MIDNFLRPPRGVLEHVADALRLFGLAGVLFAVLFREWTDAGILAFTLPGLLLARFIGMVAWGDIVVSVTLLIAAWSNVFDLYTTVRGWDNVVHFFCAGVLSVACYLLLVQWRIVPVLSAGWDRSSVATVVLITAFGLALGALWEMVEWVGLAYITPDIFVTYEDTIGDMAAGGLGALVMGLVAARIPLLRADQRGRQVEWAQESH